MKSLTTCAVLVLSLLGCGGGTAPPEVDSTSTAQIAGTVTVQGKKFKGTGYQLVLVSESGQSAIISLNPDGTFTGAVPPGTMKAGVLPEVLAIEAHGDASKLSSPVSITLNPGENNDVKVDLTSPPPAIPKAGPAGGGGGHVG